MRVTVFGSARLRADSPEYAEARTLGRLLAEEGHVVVSGGYGGLMEAVSRGARDARGDVVGITLRPWSERLRANPYLSEERPAETLYARLEALIESDALIALPGGAGTLAEVALAWNLQQIDLGRRKPVILVGNAWRELLDAFRRLLIISDQDLRLIILADTAADAVTALGSDQLDPGTWQG